MSDLLGCFATGICDKARLGEDKPGHKPMGPHVQHPAPRPPAVETHEDLSDEEGLDKSLVMQGDEFDSWGFAVPPEGGRLTELLNQYSQWFQPKALRRLRRFEFRRSKLDDPTDWGGVPKATLKQLLRKGVPPQHRADVWWSILGCEGYKRRSPRTYNDYKTQVLNPKTAEEIERDLPRTFPSHKKFRTAAGRTELRNVLTAFANHSPKVLYCQGLNFITGLFLIVLENEERAFWALVCAVEGLGVEGYYSQGMTLLRADMQVLSTFMTSKCPKVAQELKRHSIELTAVCSEWFITWFAKSLPISTVVRVWDTLFFEGFKVLFRVAIGVFKCVEQEVLKCGSFDGIMEQAKSWPHHLVQHNELLKASFDGIKALRRADLLQARDEALCAIEKEDAEHKRRIQENRENRAKAAAAKAAAEAAKAAEAQHVSVGPAVVDSVRSVELSL